MTVDREDGDADRFRRSLEWTLGVPFQGGNRVEVLRNGVRIFPAIFGAVAEARRTIDFVTFVFWTGDVARELANVLADKAREGVRVRVCLDGFGCKPMDPELADQLAAAGAELRWFRPPKTWWRPWRADSRTHRKVIICDGRVGFTGGVGIASEWEGDARHPGEWRDTHLRVEGPAVRALEAAFLGNWAEAGGDVTEDVDRIPDIQTAGDVEMHIVRATSAVGWSDIATLMRTVVAAAQRRLRITTAYFAPDGEMVRQLCLAARRGVDVHVLVPGRWHDQRASQLAGQAVYEELLEAGVRLSLYQRTMLHAKVVTADGVLSVVGSPNFNYRSMLKDDEACAAMLDREVAAVLDEHFEEDALHARALTLEQWRDRPLGERLREVVARHVLAPQV